MLDPALFVVIVLSVVAGFVGGRAYGMELVIRRIIKAHYES